MYQNGQTYLIIYTAYVHVYLSDFILAYHAVTILQRRWTFDCNWRTTSFYCIVLYCNLGNLEFSVFMQIEMFLRSFQSNEMLAEYLLHVGRHNCVHGLLSMHLAVSVIIWTVMNTIDTIKWSASVLDLFNVSSLSVFTLLRCLFTDISVDN